MGLHMKSKDYLKSFKTSKIAQIWLNLKNIFFSLIANFTWEYNEFYQTVQSCRILRLIFGETKIMVSNLATFM